MLTTAEISSMAAQVTRSLIDTTTQLRPGVTVDAEGNPVQALATIGTLPAWLVHPDRNGADPTELGGQAGQTLDPVVLLAAGADVRVDDRLVISGDRYRVRSVATDRFYVRAEVHLVER